MPDKVILERSHSMYNVLFVWKKLPNNQTPHSSFRNKILLCSISVSTDRWIIEGVNYQRIFLISEMPDSDYLAAHASSSNAWLPEMIRFVQNRKSKTIPITATSYYGNQIPHIRIFCQARCPDPTSTCVHPAVAY